MKARYRNLAPLMDWRDRPDWSRLPGALCLEIGFGNGEYLVRNAAAHPETRYVGVEITWGSVRRALGRAAAEGIENLHLCLGDARAVLEWGFPERCLDSAYSLFPCPWPKKRHAKNRLFQRPFLELINSRLKDSGEFQVVTDHAPYRDQILEEVDSLGFQTSLEIRGSDWNTKYERKWSDQGQQEFYSLVMKKNRHHNIPYPETLELNKRKAEKLNIERYQPKSSSANPVVDFKRFLYDESARTLMQEVVAVESHLSQHFWIEVKESRGAWWVQVSPASSVLPVVSVQKAIDLTHQAVLDSA